MGQSPPLAALLSHLGWHKDCIFYRKSCQASKQDLGWRQAAEIWLPWCRPTFWLRAYTRLPIPFTKDLSMLFAILYRQPLDCFPCLIDEEAKQAHSIHSLSGLYLLCETLHNLFRLLQRYCSISPCDLNSCSAVLVAFLSAFSPSRCCSASWKRDHESHFSMFLFEERVTEPAVLWMPSCALLTRWHPTSGDI